MDGKKVKLRLEHISQSYIVKNEVSDAVVDVSLDEMCIRDRSTALQCRAARPSKPPSRTVRRAIR